MEAVKEKIRLLANEYSRNLKKISEYKNINSYLKKIQKIPAIKKTTFKNHIKRHYYYSHENINPFRIIPLGPN